MKDIINTIRENYNFKNNPSISVDLNHLKNAVTEATETEIAKTKEVLKKLKNDLGKFPSLYCNKYGHDYIAISYRILGKTGWHSFLGEERVYEIKEQCTICGQTSHIWGMELYCRPDIYESKKQLPAKIHDDQSLVINGKTYRMTEEEISRLEKYLEYIHSIKSTIYDLINKTLERERLYRNIRRSKTIFWNSYIDYIKKYPIIYNVETFLQFPTFEEYQSNNKAQEQSQPLKRERKK